MVYELNVNAEQVSPLSIQRSKGKGIGIRGSHIQISSIDFARGKQNPRRGDLRNS